MSRRNSNVLIKGNALTPKSELPWTTQEVWLRVIIYYTLVMAFMLTLQLSLGDIFFDLFQGEVNREFLTTNLIFSLTGILGIGLTFLFLKFDDRKMTHVGLSLPKEMKFLAAIAIISTPIALMIGFFIEILGEVISIDQMLNDCFTCNSVEIVTIIQGIINFIIQTVVVLLGIGVGEEIIFRGYLQRVLESQLSFWYATLTTAFLFGLLHVFLLTSFTTDTLNNMIAVGGSAFIFGFVFSYAYKISGRNLFFPIIIHAVWNSIIFFFKTDFNYETPLKVAIEIFSQLGAALFLFIVLWYLQKNYKPKNILNAW